MSYTVKSNKVYANINDLPQDYAIKNGDKLIVQRNDETYIVDYGDVMIDLEHVTFHETFTEMVNFTSNCTEFMTEMTNSFNELSDSVSNIEGKHAEIVGRLDAIEAILKLIYCCEDNKREEKVKEDLSADGKEQFERIKTGIAELYETVNAGIEFKFMDNNFTMRLLG